MIYRVGVTGTRHGMSEHQKELVTIMMFHLAMTRPTVYFHHGDCVGVDIEVATIAHRLSMNVICHPPMDPTHRGWFPDNYFSYEDKTHFARNRDIVDAVDLLLVVPLTTEHQKTGGTWYTHDYAIKKNVPLKIFPREPSGLGL
jgi:hypothetical protein